MKFLVAILSFYFLALNIMPCSDDDHVSEGVNVEFMLDSDTGQDHGDCELCSPFCHCHCCHTHTIGFEFTAFEPVQSMVTEKNFSHFDSLGKEIPFSLFQPPRNIS